MKDYSQTALKKVRPTRSPLACVDYCLAQLYQDKVHSTSDFVSPELTFEELIGTLLISRDIIKRAAKEGVLFEMGL